MPLQLVADDERSLIAVNIPQCFGLIFDSWSDGNGRHFVAVFVTFHDLNNKPKRVLLAITPLLLLLLLLRLTLLTDREKLSNSYFAKMVQRILKLHRTLVFLWSVVLLIV